MMKVNKNSKCSQTTKLVTVLKQWAKLLVNTNKHEDLNLVFANHGKRMDHTVLLQQRQQKHKRKITRSILKRCKTSKLDWRFQLIENIIVLYKDENQSSQHLYKQGNQLVSPLPNPSHSCLKETMRSVIDWTGEVYIILSGHKTNLVNPAKTRDTAKSMVLH